MPVVRNTFTDPITSAVYTFHLNPRDGGSPQYKKTISSQTTTAPGGNVLLYEGADEPRTGTINGTILSLAHYQAMVTWFQKRYPVVMTDDLGRSLTIYITEFLPTRKRSVSHRYLHDFSCSYVVLSGADL
jgi:hypothetical protein